MFLFSQTYSVAAFEAHANTLDSAADLTDLRNLVCNYKRAHTLRHNTFGFALLYRALDERARFLKFQKYSWGYSDPHFNHDACIAGINKGMNAIARARANVMAMNGNLPVGPDPTPNV